MAYEGNLQCIPGLKAGADLSAKQFTFVTIAADGDVEANTTAGALVPGVLQNKPLENQEASVAYGGVSKVVAGDTVAAGDFVRSNTAGKAVANAGAAAPGYFTRGIALTGGAADELISVLLAPTGYLHNA